MTKVAIKGPVEGAGNYNLRVPVTEDNHDVELPLGSTQLAGADSNGMPQLNDGTPIVESGSNSDGIWTKFADGKLDLRGATSALLTTTNQSGGFYFSNLDVVYAHPSIASPTVVPVGGRIDSNGAGLTWASLFNRTATGCTLSLVSNSATSQGRLSYLASGWWK